ncbi:MAG: cytidylate kinase-like family protein [Verrucomicrobiota bacterium]|nr:cytidylate kinase-like family protein [Verrucomicrobiota bacterium]
MTKTAVEHWPSFITSQFHPLARFGEETGFSRTVTISRQAGCDALAVAGKLTRYLQMHSPRDTVPWKVFDRNLMDQVLEEHGLSAHLAKYLPEDRVSELEDLVADLLGVHPPLREVVRQSAETILELAAFGNVILIGRGGTVITAGLPQVIHVRLVAPFENRVRHAQAAYNLKPAEARAFCLRADRGRERYLKTYFNADINDPLLYHMTLNTGWLSFEETARVIGDAVLNLS